MTHGSNKLQLTIPEAIGSVDLKPQSNSLHSCRYRLSCLAQNFDMDNRNEQANSDVRPQPQLALLAGVTYWPVQG